MKKGRHRRYEEARALKRGPDLDVERLFDDLGGERPVHLDDTDDPLAEADEWVDEDDDELAPVDDFER